LAAKLFATISLSSYQAYKQTKIYHAKKLPKHTHEFPGRALPILHGMHPKQKNIAAFSLINVLAYE
jgi:hypothetical protein